jgi:diguanylate cyclase (GGDEF)-like protein/PAS domain S-box-containing protein
MDSLPLAVYVEALDGTIDDIGSGIEPLLGTPRTRLVGAPFDRRVFVVDEDAARVSGAVERSRSRGEPLHEEYRILHPDGSLRWLREDRVLLRDGDGAPMCWIGTLAEITDLVQVRRELHESRSRYGALVEQIPAIVYVDAADERMSTNYVSPQLEQLLGYTVQEYVEDPGLWKRMLHPQDRPAAVDAYLRGRASGQPFVFEYRLIARDGRELWFRDSAIVIADDDGRPHLIQGVMLDITERKAAEAQIAYLAYHDKLTGLANRAMFDELLDLALARGRRADRGVAVLSVDLDDFKLINDSLGHEAGDDLIRDLADRVGDATRDTDLVARPGGDEFLILLADLDRTPPMPGGQDGATISAEAVAVRIQQAMLEPFEAAGTELYLSASVGISVFPNDAEDAATLLKNADTAMFRSKKAGPGGYVVHAAEDASAMSRLSLSTRLRKAVETKQWVLHYQPLIELGSGRMYGVEALIRWPEPNGSLVPPGEFIPLAEEMGLIEAIGDWVVDEICRQDAQWRAEGLELELGFNLSPRQLWQPDLVEKIASPLVIAGIDPTRVTVEITESTAMTDPDRVVAILQELHRRGLKLAIDDFGTGYSSLARLKHMPVDILKIDRSFVRDVDRDRDAANMVGAMISLAENLGMAPLAEGIETRGEWEFLAERGCGLGQGFFFSRPVPASEILAMHRRASIHLVGDEVAG